MADTSRAHDLVVEQYRVLAGYNTWMNRKLYAVAATLSDAARTRDLGAFFRSVHGTLNHLLLTDRGWLRRLTQDPALYESRDSDGSVIALSGDLGQDLYADFATLRHERERTDAAIEGWAATLTAERLGAPLAYRTNDGTRYEHPTWWATTHFFNHQTHHRGQVTALLKQCDRDPGVTDLVVLLRSRTD